MNVVDNIKQIRLNKGITQQVLADALGVDTAVISNIENGKRELKVKDLEVISICLGVSVLDLFTYPEKCVEKKEIVDETGVEVILQIRINSEKKSQLLEILLGENGGDLLNNL